VQLASADSQSCQQCEDEDAWVVCVQCSLFYCRDCDVLVHQPSNMAAHRRMALHVEARAAALSEAEPRRADSNTAPELERRKSWFKRVFGRQSGADGAHASAAGSMTPKLSPTNAASSSSAQQPKMVSSARPANGQPPPPGAGKGEGKFSFKRLLRLSG
jgi:hypothetical protein